MATQEAKTVTSRLRFPEFRGGEGWSTEKMDRLYSFGRNNILSRDRLNYVDGTVKNIHYGDIHTKFPATFDVSREQVPFVNHGEALPGVASGDYCVEGDLVFADASEDMNDVGKTMEIVRLHGERVLAGQHTILARQLGGKFVTGFGAYLFDSGLMRARIKKEAQGTKVYQISAARLRGIGVTYPNDKAEQQKIVDCMTSLDEVIAAQGRKVKVLKAHKRGLMQQLFPREGETRPRLRFPEFRNAPEWEDGRVGDTLPFVTSGSRGWAAYYADTGPLFVRITNLSRSSILLDLSDSKFVALPPEATEGVRTQLKLGDVLISITADTGIIGYVDDSVQSPAYINQHIALVRFDGSKVLGRFAAYFLASEVSQRQFRGSTDSGAKAGMNLLAVQSMKLQLPVLAEQNRIADCLTAVDTLISAESNQLAALKTHKQGLMQHLFPAAEVACA